MTKLIHLDIAALLILVIILISQFTRRMSKGTTNHFFIALVIMTILSGAADIWAVVLDNAGSLNLGFALRLIRSIYWHTTPFPRCFSCMLSALQTHGKRSRQTRPPRVRLHFHTWVLSDCLCQICSRTPSLHLLTACTQRCRFLFFHIQWRVSIF